MTVLQRRLTGNVGSGLGLEVYRREGFPPIFFPDRYLTQLQRSNYIISASVKAYKTIAPKPTTFDKEDAPCNFAKDELRRCISGVFGPGS